MPSQTARPRPVTRRGWFLFGAMGVIWGVPYLLIKVAVADLSPASLVFLRTVTGALVLLPIAHRHAGRSGRCARIGAGSCCTRGSRWRCHGCSSPTPSATSPAPSAGLLIAGVPFVGALLALLTGGDDRLDGRRLAGLLVGLFGVATLVGFDVSGGSLGAVGEIAVVTVGYALGPMIIARRLRGVPAVGVVAASLVLTAWLRARRCAATPRHAPSLKVILAVAGLGVVCTALAFLLFFALIAEVGPVRATVITYVNPAVALVLGVAVLGERFTVATGVGFVLILLGSYLATSRTSATPRRRRDREVEMAPSTGVP